MPVHDWMVTNDGNLQAPTLAPGLNASVEPFADGGDLSDDWIEPETEDLMDRLFRTDIDVDSLPMVRQ